MIFLFPLIALVSLFILEILYFKLADHFNVIDKPNHRSSHRDVTIRGGGIIFSIAALIFFLGFGFQYPFFIVGLLLISIISFIDDVLTLNNKIRLGIHLVSVILMFYQWELFALDWYWILIAVVFVIGTINAYNFMDGINGITGGYSLLTIGTLYFINERLVSFTSADLLITIFLSLIVFNFFNFRKKAKCFAGDVGSVSIAFIIVFLIGQLIIYTQNFNYILLLLLYGLDAVSTVFFRLVRKENIFEAHRSHLYQFLSNEKKWPHLLVVAVYIVVQLLINLLVVFTVKANAIFVLLLLMVCTLLFLTVRFIVEGKERLLEEKSDRC